MAWKNAVSGPRSTIMFRKQFERNKPPLGLSMYFSIQSLIPQTNNKFHRNSSNNERKPRTKVCRKSKANSLAALKSLSRSLPIENGSWHYHQETVQLKCTFLAFFSLSIPSSFDIRLKTFELPSRQRFIKFQK